MKELLKLLGVEDEVAAIAAVNTLKSEKDTATQSLKDETARADTAEGTLNEQEADTIIAKAIEDKKILPKQEQWARDYFLKDKEGFTAYLEAATEVGPGEGELGGAGDKAAKDVTEAESKIGKEMGVSDEELQKQHEIEAEQVAKD